MSWRSTTAMTCSLAIGARNVSISLDMGVTWNTEPFLGIVPSDQGVSIVFGNGVWIATGANGSIMRSDDVGATWLEVDTLLTGTISGGAYEFSTFVLGSVDGTASYSVDDGLTWTLVEDTTFGAGQQIFAFCTSGASVLALAGDGATQAAYFVEGDLVGVEPSTVASDGGYLLDIEGTFELGVAMTVTIGLGEDAKDAYSGIPGQGTTVYALTTSRLRAYTPALAPGTYQLSVSVDGSQLAAISSALLVVPAEHRLSIFSLRAVLPPKWRTGPRSLEQVPSEDTDDVGPYLPVLEDL